jgi:hypothetical protein
MHVYNRRRLIKNPGAWREKYRKERDQILALLGRKCIVCGASNQAWLHVDFVPTTRGKPARHPRKYNYVKAHQKDFRILCANHHYELTITGKIEGTNLRQ